MKKILPIIGMILFAGTAICLGIMLSQKSKDVEAAQAQNTALQQQIVHMQNSFQQTTIEQVGVLRFKGDIPTGAEITAEDVELVYIAEATYTEGFVKSVDDLPALAARPCKKGTVVQTNDLAYDPYIIDKKFTRELVFESLPLGLQAGDFIDIRMALPNGETYTILTHIKCEYVAGTAISIKVSEEEWMLIDSMIQDNATYNDVTLFYLVRYLDPGADTSVAFYPVTNELATFVTFNPNIKDTTRLINPTLRNHIDEVLTLYSTSQNQSVAAAYIQGLSNQFACQLNMGQTMESDNTDEETGEYTRPGFLEQDGSSINGDDAFTEKVDDAIDELNGALKDFEQGIE